MKTILMLTKRNIQLYLKDRTLVFFSMLTILIIILLNIFFLQKMNVDNLIDAIAIERQTATHLISSLTLAGIVFTSTLTVPLSVIGIMIQDKENNHIMTFMVAPLSRFKLTLGYIFASFIMGCVFSFITLAVSQIYIVSIGGLLLSFNALLKLIVVILINVFSNACLVFLLATCVQSLNSFSALNTILGTLIGFVAGIYMPIGILPEIVQSTIKFFPGLYGASLMREIYVADTLAEVFKGAPASASETYSQFMGITLMWGERQVTPSATLLILIGSGIIFILLSTFILTKKKVTDR